MPYQRFVVTEDPDTNRHRVLDMELGQYLDGEETDKSVADSRAKDHNWLYHLCKTEVPGAKKAQVRA